MNELVQGVSHIHNRYTLLHQLGAGGMGVVYRAADRLTGKEVALKRVTVSGLQPVSAELRLALAHEFQALATLRHPHVIAVWDYGFDAYQMPFFTMELLPQSRSIVDAAQVLSPNGRIHLLLQLLSALVYIHRRGIIHRDLKPGNVPVTSGSVKLLDFGLSIVGKQERPSSGTLLYMAPELLRGSPATVASDLYAVGMIAYELFAGWHPFANTQNLPQAILQQPPDMTYIDLPPALTAVLQKLLAKDPAARYPDAAAVIAALCHAVDLPLPPETAIARDSFLQAAPFIGRTAEMGKLQTALQQAARGNGSAWLVRGESGIGKTRLLQEVRTAALVDGMAVLRGQAQAAGGAYHLWTDVLRHLILLTDLDDLETAVLQPIVPDIATIMQKPVSPAPPLDAKAAQTRLTLTIADLLRRAAANRPLLLLLEDLHWADDNSLSLLHALTNIAADHPLSLIGSYRPGERPSLAQNLPHMQVLTVNRLEPDQLAELSAAMLGENGRQTELIRFLQQETEGNTFFMVEVLRSLAEEAGRLDRISASTLPETIFPGGVQQVIQHRLDRIPLTDRSLLQLTAVAGRQIDLPLLAHLMPDADAETWLTTCVNAAVIERSDDALDWHFSHDKLREALLRQIPVHEQQTMHHQIGIGIETIYAGQLASYYGRLAHHFAAAGLTDRQRRYLHLAAKHAENSYANEAAVTYYQQLLPLLDQPASQVAISLQLGRICKLTGSWDRAYDYLQTALTQAETAADTPLLAAVYLALGSLERSLNRYEEALDRLTQAQANYQALQDQNGLCEALVETANVFYHRGSYQVAGAHLAKALAAAQAADSPANLALVQHNMGSVAYSQGQYATAISHYQAALTLREAENDQPELANSYNNLGLVAFRQGDFATAEDYLLQSLTIRRAIGDRWGMAASLNNLGMIPYQQRDFPAARTFWEETLQIRRTLGEEWALAGSLDNLALVATAQGDLDTGKALFEEALHLRQQLNDRQGLAITLSNRGRLALLEEDWQTAVSHYRKSLQIASDIGDQLGVVFALLGIAAVWVRTNSILPAVKLLAAAQQQLNTIDSAWETDELTLFETSCQQAQASLPDGFYEQAWQAGRSLTIDNAVRAALEEKDVTVTI